MQKSITFKLYGTTKRTVKYQAPPNEVFGNGLQEAMLWLNPASLPQPFPEEITVTVSVPTQEVEVANTLEVE